MKSKFNGMREMDFILKYGLFLFVILFSACSKNDDEDAVNNGNETIDIVEVLGTFNNGNSNQSFKTLQAALEQTGLDDAVSSGQLTLFAPSDAAFAAIGVNAQNVGSVEGLSEILLYHVVDGKVQSGQLSAGFKGTLNGAAVQVNLNDGARINDAVVVKADIMARNGVIHAIDKVLLPPTRNIVELAQSLAPEFTLLVDAVVKADLVQVLAGDGQFTVFAPTNAAFSALFTELGVSGIDEVPVDVLTQVLLYHVVDGRVYSSDLTNGSVNTLNGSFDVDVSNLEITDANDRAAGLVTTLLNVQATNGVIHVIDKVILP